MLRTHQSKPGLLVLEGAATLATAEELHSALAGLLNEPEPVTVDTSGLQDLDTAGLQVLLAFVRARGAERTTCAGWPTPLRQLIQLAGLPELLA